MNVLVMGLPFGVGPALLKLYQSQRGHNVRFLAVEGEADFHFLPEETCEQVVARVSKTWQPDLLLCWCPEMFPPPLEVEHCPIRTAACISDWNIYFPQLEFNLARFDVVCTDKQGASRLRLQGAQPRYFQPLYSQLSSVQRDLGLLRDVDIVFAGNLSGSLHVARGKNLEQIAALADRYRVIICCGPIEEAYATLLNRARIVFNRSVRGEMNLRCFEAAACGALLFVEEDNLEVRDWLCDREDAVFYNDDNLIELLLYYLEHEDERARIATNGQARIASFSGEARLDSVIEFLAAAPTAGRSFESFSEEQRTLSELLWYSACIVSPQRDYAARQCDEALRRWPEDPAFLTAAAAVRLDRFEHLPMDEQKRRAKEVVALLHRAAEAAPDAAPLWLNLAHVARQCGGGAVERRCLERCLSSSSTAYGNQLMGVIGDSYYARWRRQLATGEAKIELLWAYAAAQLADVHADAGTWETALSYAAQSTAWIADIAQPYRTAARALQAAGNAEEAVRMLEQGLPYTVFDAGYRADLVLAYLALDRLEDAQRIADESERILSTVRDTPLYNTLENPS